MADDLSTRPVGGPGGASAVKDGDIVAATPTGQSRRTNAEPPSAPRTKRARDVKTDAKRGLRSRKSPGDENSERERLAAVVAYGRHGDIKALVATPALRLATPEQRARLIETLLDGATGGEEERAILTILRQAGETAARAVLKRLGERRRLQQLIGDIDGIAEKHELLTMLQSHSRDRAASTAIFLALAAHRGPAELVAAQSLLDMARNRGELSSFVNGILDVLTRPELLRRFALVGLDDATFERLLDASTASAAHSFTDAELVFDGASSYNMRAAATDEAQRTLWLQYYDFVNDDVGWAMAEKLIERKRAGVDVRVIIDALGAIGSDNAAMSQDVHDHLRAHGIEVRVYRPLLRRPSLHRAHEKLQVADGTVGIAGGLNVGEKYGLRGMPNLRGRSHSTGDPWRDTDMLVRGPAVLEMAQSFARTWALLGPPIPSHLLAPVPASSARADGARVRYVDNRPAEDGTEYTYNLYLLLANRAAETIYIENAYFVPPAELRAALVAARRRGVRVVVVTNSPTTSDLPFVAHAGRHLYSELLEAGVEIYESRGQTLHSKTAVIDQQHLVVGSMNLDEVGVSGNSESVWAMRDRTVAGRLHRSIEVERRRARQITLTDVPAFGWRRWFYGAFGGLL